MRVLFVLFLTVLVAFLVVVCIYGLNRLHRQWNLSTVDIISFQISLLSIMLTTITLGGGILAFVSWKELRSKAEKHLEKVIAEFTNKKQKIIIDEVVKNIQKQKASDQVDEILGQSDIEKA